MFLLEEFLEGKPIIPTVNEVTRRLEGSDIAKSSQHRLKTSLNDIKKHHNRVYSILLRLNDVQSVEDGMTNVLEQLDREELLSPEQFEKLNELENIDLSTVANIIKDTKIGYGIGYGLDKKSYLYCPN